MYIKKINKNIVEATTGAKQSDKKAVNYKFWDTKKFIFKLICFMVNKGKSGWMFQ